MSLRLEQSRRWWERALKVIPGGVNSPVRAFHGVARPGRAADAPLFIERAAGAEIFDIDGNSYIDYVGSWGPMILGHAAEPIERALAAAIRNGTSFGAPTRGEVEIAELLSEIVPGLEMVRLVNSGTEATMSALRLARGATGRQLVIKCDGCYHGHSDSFLVAAGSGVATLGIPGSPGVVPAVAELTLSVAFNDLAAMEEAIAGAGADNIAAVIVEPVPGNMGLVLPEEGYLSGLRRLCDEHGIILIFDEVMSGFRAALGGAGERYGVRPDLITLGKVIGGGLPVGAFGGRRDLMQQLAPSGPVYQAGTLSGNPLAVAAGLAMLKELKRINPYPQLEEMSARLSEGLAAAAKESGIALASSHCGSMIGFFFAGRRVRNYQEAKACDTQRFAAFFHEMLARGVYLAPSAFEAGFLSTAHTTDHIERTLEAARESFAAVAAAFRRS